MRLLVPLIAIAVSQAAAQSPQTVRIDVVASDAAGRTVENLKPADFELRDDGGLRTIESARFVRPAADESRLIAIFLDEYHVSRDATARVREAFVKLIDEQLRPADRLVVMKPLDSVLSIKPSPDREAAKRAVERFEGRRGEYEPRNSYEANFMAGVPARIEAARTQVALSAINALAVHFNTAPDARKTLFVVSEGMGRVERRRGLELMPTADTIVRAAQQFNVAIYAVDPSMEQKSGDSDAIRFLAAETAGGAIHFDLDSGLRRALEDASGYYLVTYQIPRVDDGRFHPVQVHVKRQGTVLRARKGYYGPSPDETLRAAVLARLNEPKEAAPPEPAPHASPLIRPWFGMSRGPDGNTRVTFVWEPTARLTGERNRRTAARIVFKALAADNSVLFESVVLPTGPAAMDSPAGARARAVFDAPPGRLRLRMQIQDFAQQQLDSDVRTITVRDMRRGPVIGTPEVLRARNAREFRALETDDAVPVASREFSRTERLLIRFRVYGGSTAGAADAARSAADARVAVSARLLSRMGPMRDLVVVAPAEAAGANAIDVPLAGLAVGEYVIEVSATSPAGDVKDVIDFRVTT